MFWHQCQKSNPKWKDLFLDPQFYSTDQCLSTGQYHTTLITVFVNSFEINKCESSNCFFLDYLIILGPLLFLHINFQDQFVNFCKKKQQKNKKQDIARHSIESIGQYWVFQSINMACCTFKIFCLSPAMFSSFQCRNLVKFC